MNDESPAPTADSRPAKERPRRKKSEVTRQRILDAAVRLFVERGYERTTMRDIAAQTGMSLGSTYYYFATKEEIVLAFYEKGCAEHIRSCEAFFETTADLRGRIEHVIRSKLDEWRPYREFIRVLTRTGIDSESPVSPFSPATAGIRADAIRLFERALEGASGVPSSLRAHLPRLLWLYQLGIVLFWVNDRSPDQRKTALLVDRSLAVLLRLVRMASLPLMGAVVRPVLQTIDELWKPDAHGAENDAVTAGGGQAVRSQRDPA